MPVSLTRIKLHTPPPTPQTRRPEGKDLTIQQGVECAWTSLTAIRASMSGPHSLWVNDLWFAGLSSVGQSWVGALVAFRLLPSRRSPLSLLHGNSTHSFLVSPHVWSARRKAGIEPQPSRCQQVEDVVFSSLPCHVVWAYSIFLERSTVLHSYPPRLTPPCPTAAFLWNCLCTGILHALRCGRRTGQVVHGMTLIRLPSSCADLVPLFEGAFLPLMF